MYARVRRALLTWYRRQARDLPWRRTRDPYRILVSEVMLQQTRAQTVIPYYARFVARYPTARALAAAPEADVLAAWSGLGYYSRARHLHAAARRIAAEGFPREYDGIGALPGVGRYTAAAVASMAFGLPYAVVDGNVLRVVARLENDASDIGAASTRERFRAVAQALLAPRHPGAFNQALMELGATVCLPRAPRCAACPLTRDCRVLAAGTAARLPVRPRRTDPVAVEATLLVVRRAGRVLLCRQGAGFWQLPAPEDLPGARLGRLLGTFRHSITHHRYTFTVRAATAGRPPGGRWFPPAALCRIPLSTTAGKALRLE